VAISAGELERKLSVTTNQATLALTPEIGNGHAAVCPKAVRATSVLHIGKYYPPHPGGMESHLSSLVSLQSVYMPVEVVVSNNRPLLQREFLDGAWITRVPCLGTLASMPLCPTLPWNLAGRSEMIVHLHVPNPWAAQSYLMSGHKGKLIITHHADTLGRDSLKKMVDPFVRAAMKRAEAIIVTSKRYLDGSEELADFRHKCRVVHLGIDVEKTRAVNKEEVSAIRAMYGPRIVVAVGRLVPYKGFEFLLRAMTEIDATLLLIGVGPLKEKLQTLIKTLGITHKAHMLGYVKDAAPYYRAAEMFVLPSISRAESTGMVQLEAMAAGIPIVNTEIDSGVPEIAPHGVTGLMVPPGDANSLAQALRSLLESEETRSKYGQAGLKRVREEFSAQRMAETTFNVYESVL
jgi:glycosyltransferase involved in cell wall biosynthesis